MPPLCEKSFLSSVMFLLLNPSSTNLSESVTGDMLSPTFIEIELFFNFSGDSIFLSAEYMSVTIILNFFSASESEKLLSALSEKTKLETGTLFPEQIEMPSE